MVVAASSGDFSHPVSIVAIREKIISKTIQLFFFIDLGPLFSSNELEFQISSTLLLLVLSHIYNQLIYIYLI
jgi:hypothetical protein